MKLLTLEIIPLSNFATYPKGDTLFSQIVSYFYLKNDHTFDNYLNEKPKLIVSDMMPFGYVYKPSLPLNCFESNKCKEIDKKKFRKQKFIKIKDLQNGNWCNTKEIKFKKELNTIKNSINRLTFTTDGKTFSPYSTDEIEIYQNLWMFVLVDEIIEEKVLKILEEIGKFGFGKDVSIGKGKFECKVIDNPNFEYNSNVYMSLSPVILKDENIINSSYEPFTRYGKFGLDRAYKNAFKKPVLVADSGTVVRLKEKKEYFGNAVENGNTHYKSFFQGYSIALPIKDNQCV
jgi:CRISPR-associated protein Csm4